MQTAEPGCTPRLPRLSSPERETPARSEANFEKCLPRSRGVALANLITVDDAKVCAIDVVRAIEVGVTDLHSIKNVSEFHPQLCSDPFTEIEVLSQCEILIAVEGAAQVSDAPGRVTQREVSWRRKSREIKDWQTLVIVVVVNIERLPCDVSGVAGSKRTAVGAD